MKLIHLTDTHLVRPGQTLFGLDPFERLNAAIDDINTHHADAEIAVITGDLTHWGEPEAYQLLKKSLDRLVVPVVPIMGNHDDRGHLLTVFPDCPVTASGFVMGTIDTTAGRLIFLDTTEPGTHAGHFCPSRQRWLEDELNKVGDRDVFLFMHHPPFETFLKPLDIIGLQDAQAFRDIVEPSAHRIRHLFYGHVHRPICGSWLGIPCSTIRGTNHQCWLDFDAQTTIPGSSEPPAYAIAFIEPDHVVVHTHDYLDPSEKYEMGSTKFDDWTQAVEKDAVPA